jgi:DNA adenine methylase
MMLGRACGCGLALSLLFCGYVNQLYINDLDRSVWAIWDSILNKGDNFIQLISKTAVTVEEWHKQRAIFEKVDTSDSLTLGFSAFFLNRTNRSGIIKNAGMIGGFNQNGAYRLDCRFNKDDLIARINRIRRYKSKIHLSNMDAIEFLKLADEKLPADTFFCIDPPYFNKGASLYTSYYKRDDHRALSEAVLGMKQPTIITYDKCDEIKTLYRDRRQFEFGLNYSAQIKRKGTELLIMSKGLRIPPNMRDSQSHRPQYRNG